MLAGHCQNHLLRYYAEYNKCVESIKKIAVKVIGEQRTSKLHFIPMTANDMHTRVTSDDNTLHMPWSNKHTMQLWHVMNQVANESCSEPLKLFRKFKASYIKHKPGTERILSVYVVGKAQLPNKEIIKFTNIY